MTENVIICLVGKRKQGWVFLLLPSYTRVRLHIEMRALCSRKNTNEKPPQNPKRNYLQIKFKFEQPIIASSASNFIIFYFCVDLNSIC